MDAIVDEARKQRRLEGAMSTFDSAFSLQSSSFTHRWRQSEGVGPESGVRSADLRIGSNDRHGSRTKDVPGRHDSRGRLDGATQRGREFLNPPCRCVRRQFRPLGTDGRARLPGFGDQHRSKEQQKKRTTNRIHRIWKYLRVSSRGQGR